MWREHLSIQLLWATAQLLASFVSPTYLVDEFVSLLHVLLKEMSMLVNPRFCLFLFLVLIKEWGGGDEFTIPLCKPKGRKLLLRPSWSRVVWFSVSEVFVDDKANGGWFLFY